MIFGNVHALDHCIPYVISKLTKPFALGECGSPCGLQVTLYTLNFLCSLAFVSSAESPILDTLQGALLAVTGTYTPPDRCDLVAHERFASL